MPRPQGPGLGAQQERFRATFDRLSQAFDSENPTLELRQDPAGIAPERALVFETAASIQNFARVARDLGIEVFAETHLDETEEFPDGFVPIQGHNALTPAFYATMPTIESFEGLLRLRRAYERGENAPHGEAPWWKLFDLLLALRPWGPGDRFSEGARATVADRLPLDDSAEAVLELELWPTANKPLRRRWREETEAKLRELGGRVIDRSSIHADGFLYEGILAGLRTDTVRALVENPEIVDGLATVEGIQFILPQTIAQSTPLSEQANDESAVPDVYYEDLPTRAALLDGTPVAAHPALLGGVDIEDVHDLVRFSLVEQRHHATAMASLILRGDLEADGHALTGSRLLSVPILVDTQNGASSPRERLLVDLIHTALLRIFVGDERAGPDVFVVNMSIGALHNRFAGPVTALARLLDWWAWQEGVLFVISAGNIPEDLPLPTVTSQTWEESGVEVRQQLIRDALRENMFERTLLSPAEAINGLTVGAVSNDETDRPHPPQIANAFKYESDGQLLPPISNALGLGPRRCIKPDLLTNGGVHEFRVLPRGNGVVLQNDVVSQRTGLIVASPRTTATSPSRRARGTSCAAALVTRALLQSADALTAEDGPYEGQELSRRDYALLTRALAVNSAKWPESALQLRAETRDRIGSQKYAQANQETARYYGHGVLSVDTMQESPQRGVTLVGFGDAKKDHAVDFAFPIPQSLSGKQVPRTMRVTIAWFSPVNPARASYRLSSLEAIALDAADHLQDKSWLLRMKTNDWDSGLIKRGSIWSRCLIHSVQTIPTFDGDTALQFRVQCSDPTNGGLDQDLEIHFAVAATLQVEAQVEFDVHQEIQALLRLRLRGLG